MSASSTVAAAGRCDPAFAAVRDEFVDNFVSRAEIGAALVVIAGGRTVVDMWGGHADAARTRPWRRDTVVNVFSVGKAMTALCVHRLAGTGRMGIDDRVARWWPEFAKGGKESVTVRHLLSHQAGLPAVRRRLPDQAVYDWRAMTDALAEQTPWWAPGSAHGYHVNTFGFLVGEVVRRVSGRSVGTVFREEIAGPLGADVHIGLPIAEESRVAEFVWPAPPIADLPEPATDDQVMEHNAYFNPPCLSGTDVVNTREWRVAEVPSANAHASAHGVARIYHALAAGGSIDGVDVVDPVALASAIVVQSDGEDRILHRRSRFGLGFQLTQPERPLGPNPRCFGHFGAGGSLGFADPDAGVAFGYVMNEMGPRWQNPRNRALIDAVYASLG